VSNSYGATQMKKEKTPWILGIVGGTIASLCCIGPLVIFFFGLGSISTALSIGKYTPFFLAAAIIFMGIAFYLHLKKKKCCNVEGVNKHKWNIIIALVIMFVFLYVVKFVLLPQIAVYVYR
jgi:mercuric ion transport protein